MGENEGYLYKSECLFTFGSMLADSMADFELTNEEFAEKAGIPIETLHKIIAGDMMITDELSDSMSKAVGGYSDYWKRMEDYCRDQMLNNPHLQYLFYPEKDADFNALLLGIKEENIKRYMKEYGWEWDYLNLGDREDTAKIMVYNHPETDHTFVFLRDRGDKEYRVTVLSSLKTLADVTGITEWRWLEKLNEPSEEVMKTMDESMENFKQGKVSEPIDLTGF